MVHESTEVVNSDFVYKSEFVEDSQSVSNSKRVKSGHIVQNSEDVSNSTHIFDSRRVRKSDYIYKSVNVESSRDVAYSAAVAWSEVILSSNTVEDSTLIYRCNNVLACLCSGFLENCTNCIFCSCLKDKELYVFNQKVSHERFDSIVETFLFKFKNEIEHSYLLEYDKSTGKVELNGRYDDMFDALGTEFFDWVSSLEEFNEDVFTQVFLRRSINE